MFLFYLYGQIYWWLHIFLQRISVNIDKSSRMPKAKINKQINKSNQTRSNELCLKKVSSVFKKAFHH